MIRAVFKAGTIEPLDPVPPDWSDGLELRVEPAELDDRLQDIDLAYQELESVCSQMPDDPEDDQRLETALAEADRIAKEQVRREMGLAG